MGASRIGVDREHVLRGLHTHPVLYGAGDPARDVEIRGDALAGLADLVGVRSPTLIGDDAGAADRRAREIGERFDRGEALLGTDTPAAAHHDRRGGQRDALRNLHPIDDPRTPGGGAELRANSVTDDTGVGRGSRVARERVERAAEDRKLRGEGRVLEEASAPARAHGSATVRRAPRARRWPRTARRRSRRRGRAPRCRVRCPWRRPRSASISNRELMERVAPRFGGVIGELGVTRMHRSRRHRRSRAAHRHR